MLFDMLDDGTEVMYPIWEIQAMKLTIYKGFDKDFLDQINEPALLEGSVEKKLNVLEFDKKTRKGALQ